MLPAGNEDTSQREKVKARTRARVVLNWDSLNAQTHHGAGCPPGPAPLFWCDLGATL